MDLKEFQRRVANDVERYLEALADERQRGNRAHASRDAWERLRLGRYEERRNGLGDDLPAFCIKVATGGGKTLLATQALGSIHRTILASRNGAGLALWIVPSGQIYRDTLRRLKNRGDLYRLMLEHAVSRRIEVWEKQDIARLSPVSLRECLNVLVLQLASTNRETREQVKLFRDSGGSIVEHFPPEDDAAAHRRLKSMVRNLDMIEDDEQAGRHLIATSIGNLVRLCSPPVILDEGHRATSRLARTTLEGLNASVVVELSATPQRGANIVSSVSGEELLREEMIKLPVNIATSGREDWRDILTRARDRREILSRAASEHASATGRLPPIRPIVLVQVERTGREQRDRGLIHAKDVEEHLVERLSVTRDAIAIKSAEDDGLEAVDLLEAGCPIEWIITKSALQEGWDCPFAYVLVSLSGTRSARAMTQLVGRVLRQPYQERAPCPALNECYVYCLRQTAGEVARQVKAALEKEGYDRDSGRLIVDASDGSPGRIARDRRRRVETRVEPRRAIEGAACDPGLRVKKGGETRRLDYFEDLIRRVDVERFEYDGVRWKFSDRIGASTERFSRVDLSPEAPREAEADSTALESDARTLSWLVANLRVDVLSYKQLRRIARRVYEQLASSDPGVLGRLALVKLELREKVAAFIREGIDHQVERALAELRAAGRIELDFDDAACRLHARPRRLDGDRALTGDGGRVRPLEGPGLS
jgi:type III restriction enzyme